MKKVLLTATVQSHICQFHKPLVEMLHENGYEVEVAARNNLAEKNGLKLDFVDNVYEISFQRSPFNLKNIGAYRQLKQIIDNGGYDVIHCNTPVAGVLTRLAARKKRKQGTKVVYTAHGFHFFKGAPLSAWLVWYPIEKFMAKKCDILVTVNEEDYEFARTHFRTRVEHIHGVGVDEKRFHPVTPEEQHEMRTKEDLSDDDFVVLCTGELLPNKNQKTLIEATALIKESIPNIKVLLAGNGPEEANLRGLINKLNLKNEVRLLGYRKDLENIVPAIDVAVSCSYREGMPLNIIEAMLCAKPVIASNNRGHNELVEYGITGYLIEPNDKIFLSKIISTLAADELTKKNMGMAGRRCAQHYSLSEVYKELKKAYS